MRGKSWSGIIWASALLVGAVILYLRPLVFSRSPSSLAIGPASAGSRRGPLYFPNVPLITQDGKTVRFYDDLLKGKSVAINVIYTSCQDECPLQTVRLVQLQRLLGDRVGKDLFFYSITIDPERDTPEVLKAYAERFHVGPGWLFLTGKAEDIKLITGKLGLSSLNDLMNRDGHQTRLLVGNEPTGQWTRKSSVDNPQFLAATISNFLGWKTPNLGKSYAQAQPLTLGEGEYIFRARCVPCHTIGRGDAVGPDLAGVTTRRDRDWLARYLAAPDRMRAEGDPIATALFAKYRNIPMPNLSLGQEEIATLLAYLEESSGAPPR